MAKTITLKIQGLWPKVGKYEIIKFVTKLSLSPVMIAIRGITRPIPTTSNAAPINTSTINSVISVYFME